MIHVHDIAAGLKSARPWRAPSPLAPGLRGVLPMLTILGQPQRHPFCDGVKRRDFLKIGGLAMGGPALPDLLRGETAAGIPNSHKTVVMIFLPRGPPHQEFLH